MSTRTKSMTNNMADNKLHQFFMDQLQDIYWAEKKLVKTLPKLEEAATSRELRKAFSDHLMQTKTHVTVLKTFSICWAKMQKQKNVPPWLALLKKVKK